MNASKYDPQEIEPKWQKYWEEHPELYAACDNSDKPRQYILDMFPYPSGDGLHAGHVESYTATDIMSRYLRLKGHNVLHPQGWDAFGLPAENYAIKTQTHPAITTKRAIDNFKHQMKMMGFSYDWSREIASMDPDYYKWTQWFFLLLYKNGYAYKSKAKVNWCDSCKTVLANEQVVDGKCERCGNPVVQRDLEQWFFKITDFIEDKNNTSGLISGLDKVDWPESTKAGQRNWIGKSEGSIIRFKIQNSKSEEFLEVFTTRLDTIYGCTYMVIAPEHSFVEKHKTEIENYNEIQKYLTETKKKSDLDRMENKDKTGVEIKGIKAVNPFTNVEVPIFVADYVLVQYGTGAVMAVPAHDERDWEFAKKYYLSIKKSIANEKTQEVFLIHGSPREDKTKQPDYIPNNINHWFGWLKEQLMREKYEVINPQMPEPWLPRYEDWKKEFEKKEVKDNSILVGHSAGGAFLVRWLGETNKKIEKLILISPGKIIRKEGGRLKDLYSFEVNKNLRNNIGEIIVFTSDDEEPHRIENAKMYAAELGGKLIILSKRGHFIILDNEINHKFPELLNEIVLGSQAKTEDGVLVNSGEYTGLKSGEAREKMTEWLEKNNLGSKKVNYKMRDWLVSRQRYWGAPIPIIYCEKCGEVPVPEEDLPVKLPTDVDFKPTGESPLVYSKEFHDVKCPKCGGAARRESDTMDTFVCSSWYYFRYADTKNEKEFASKEMLKKWLPVDLYVGGAEHTVLHLLYSRFFTKVLHNLGYIEFDEPFLKLRHQGIILASDGRKMSKSLGNVVNPDDEVKKHGADALRMFEMFMGPLEDMKPWQTNGIVGVYRFLEKVYKLADKVQMGSELGANKNLQNLLHKTIKKVSEDIENLRFNTAISAMMILANEMDKQEEIEIKDYELLITILAPFAPFMTEELWSQLGHKESIFKEKWPEYDPELIKDEEVDLVIQVNGKVRDRIKVSADISEDEAKKIALESEKIRSFTSNKEIKKIIFVKGKLLSIVTN